MQVFSICLLTYKILAITGNCLVTTQTKLLNQLIQILNNNYIISITSN